MLLASYVLPTKSLMKGTFGRLEINLYVVLATNLPSGRANRSQRQCRPVGDYDCDDFDVPQPDECGALPYAGPSRLFEKIQ